MSETSVTAALPTDNPVPRTIPRSAHPISRKNIDREALKVLHRLRDAGHTAYLVGGGVRDLYLGKKPKDFDISTDARPGQLRKLFKNSRLIGRRFRLVQIFFHGNKIIEVSTFRCSSEYDINNGKHVADDILPANNTFGNPVEDAFRRDLTINALFYDLNNFSIIDYTGGVEDIDRGIIRLIGDPERRITRDPVRMMRVIRHASRNGFTIDADTWQAVLAQVSKLRLCPISRLRDEMMKDLRGGASKPWARLAIDSGIFQALLPFYAKYLNGNDDLPDLADRLLAVFALVDRIHNLNDAKTQLPDHLLLALILLPWAESEMDLLTINLKRNDAFHFSRQFRSKIDDIVLHLGMKRSVRESATTMLVNLPVFYRFARNSNWPKWLMKKNYYSDCHLFYLLHSESKGGPQVDPVVLVKNIASLSKTVKTRKKGSYKKKRQQASVYRQ